MGNIKLRLIVIALMALSVFRAEAFREFFLCKAVAVDLPDDIEDVFNVNATQANDYLAYLLSEYLDDAEKLSDDDFTTVGLFVHCSAPDKYKLTLVFSDFETIEFGLQGAPKDIGYFLLWKVVENGKPVGYLFLDGTGAFLKIGDTNLMLKIGGTSEENLKKRLRLAYPKSALEQEKQEKAEKSAPKETAKPAAPAKPATAPAATTTPSAKPTTPSTTPSTTMPNIAKPAVVSNESAKSDVKRNKGVSVDRWEYLLDNYNRLVMKYYGVYEKGKIKRQAKPARKQYISRESANTINWNGCDDGDHVYEIETNLNRPTLNIIRQVKPVVRNNEFYQTIVWTEPTKDGKLEITTVDQFGIGRVWIAE